MKTMSRDVSEYLISIVKQTIEHRERHRVSRKDFIQCLIELRNNQGKVSEDDSGWDTEMVSDTMKAMTIEQCAAQVFLFYLAGFDTSASTIAYCLFELARNEECAAKLRAEIDDVLQRYDGELTYDCIKEMKYLDLCVMGKCMS